MAVIDPFSFDDYDNVIGFVVSQAGALLARTLEDAIASVGSDLRPREFALLNRLHQHGQLTQIQLADLTYKDKPEVTRMLQRLIARKLVTKIKSSTDRRAYVVSLTSRGEAIRQIIVPEMRKRLEAACEGLRPVDLQTTVAVLRHMIDQTQGQPAPRPGPPT